MRGIDPALAPTGAAGFLDDFAAAVKAAIDKAMDIDYFSEVADSLGLPKGAKRRSGKRWGLVSAALGRQDNRFAFATDFWEGRKDDGKPGAGSKRPSQAARWG